MTPAATLLEELARARRAGQEFEQAWSEALPIALAHALDREERTSWAEVLGGMVEAWRRAWERRPASGHERALVLVADREPGVPLPDRECEHCGQAIPPDRGRSTGVTLYCSERCRRAAYDHRRARAAA